MLAAILSIGDELTLGQTIDANSAWLSDQLVSLGALTIEHRTVADDQAAIVSAVRELARRVQVLLITGGLGPTEDDLTREALADVITPGQSLVIDQTALKHLEKRFARRGIPMPTTNRKQAMRPATMRLLANPRGTAPGLAGRFENCDIFAMPGPPAEMKPMFAKQVVPQLSAAIKDEVILTGMVQEFGLGEADAAQRMGELMQRGRNPQVGTTAGHSIVAARIRVVGPRAESQRMLDDTMACIERAWQPYSFARGDTSLAATVGELLRRAKLTLTTAESCTGGMLSSMIVDVPGSSDYHRGGWITYCNAMKSSQLGVPEQLIEQHGAVSFEVARAMAQGALEKSGADVSVSITGIAGPDGGTARKPVGTVFIGLAQRARDNAHVVVRHFIFTGDRWTVRDRSCKTALQMLRFRLMGVDDRLPLLWEVADPAQVATTNPCGTIAYIALGSNLGDRAATIYSALDALEKTRGINVASVSELIETAPVGPGVQGPYLNAAAEIATILSARQLLDVLLRVEREHGRDRSVSQRWGPRTLDLDLLLFGEQIIDEPGLTVPHPRLHQRAFVLIPLAQIALGVVHPVLGQTIQTLRLQVETAPAAE